MNDPRTGDRVELFKGADDQWYFRRVAANNKIVSDSEGYHNLGDAQAAASRIFAGVTSFIEHDDGSWSKTDPA